MTTPTARIQVAAAPPLPPRRPECSASDAVKVCNEVIGTTLSPSALRDRLGAHWSVEPVGPGPSHSAHLVGSPQKADRWYLPQSARFDGHFDYFDVANGPRLPRGILVSVSQLPSVLDNQGVIKVLRMGTAAVDYS